MARRMVVGASRVAAVAAAAGLIFAGCGGSSKKHTETDGSAGDGAAGSGGSGHGSGGKASGGSDATGGKKASGGSGQAGGGVSESGGASTGGSGATATGGATEGGGGTAEQTTGGSGPATGGTPSEAGSSQGTGGFTLPEPEVGTVGTECSEPGALQCAGTHQRVVVTCNGDGEWEAFDTCPLGQYCDTRPGETLGSCQEPVAECVGKTPGALLCQQNDVYACGVDALTTEFVGDCPELCDAGQCAPIGACPTGTNWIKCSQDCPEHGYDEDECGESDDPYPRADLSAANAVRTPAAADMNQCANQRRRMPIRDGSPTRIDLRLRVQPPWSLVLGANSDGCAAPLGITCAVMEASGTNLVTVFTDDQSAPPANMVVEHLPAGSDEACP